MIGMNTKMVALRCPAQLIERVTALAQEQGKSRTSLIAEAILLFTRTVRKRGGRVVPPYDDEDLPTEIDFGPEPIAETRKRRKYQTRTSKES